MRALNDFDRHMAAAAFAEAGEQGTARTILDSSVAGGGKKATKPAAAKVSFAKVLVTGVLSFALYYGIFVNEPFVTDLFTKGRWYAALPIVTVFVFSFIHGAFASNLLSYFGIEAKKK